MTESHRAPPLEPEDDPIPEHEPSPEEDPAPHPDPVIPAASDQRQYTRAQFKKE